MAAFSCLLYARSIHVDRLKGGDDMSGFMGMDTSQVDDFGNLLTQRRETVDQRFQDLKGTVDSIVGSQWIGPDADSFQSQYQSEVITKVTAAVDRMQQLFDEIRQHIEEQDTTSTADDLGGVFGASYEAAGDLFREFTEFLHEVWNNFLERFGVNALDGAGLMVSLVHSFAEGYAEYAFGRVVPGIIPVMSDVFTGIMAGAERWHSEPDRPFWERLGRATVDGGANFIGSMIGSSVGGLAGGDLGARIGGRAGKEGAIAGGIIGGIIGDSLGSYIGSTIADSVIDAILD